MLRNIAPPAPAAPLPLSGHAEVILGNLLEHSQEVQAHNPRVLPILARVLAAMHETAAGHTRAIRCEHSAEYRGQELMGKAGCSLKSVVAIALECPEGLAVALAGLQALAEALGYSLAPIGAAPEGLVQATAGLIEGFGAVSIEAAAALADGHVDDVEAERISRGIDAEVGPHVATWRASRGQR